MSSIYPPLDRPSAQDRARVFRLQCLGATPRGELSFDEWLDRSEELYRYVTQDDAR